MLPSEHRRQREEVLIASVFALGAAAFTISFFMRSTSDIFGLAVVVFLSGVAERLSVRLYFEGRVSVGFVGTILSVLLFGPLGGALAVTAAMVSQFAGGQRTPQKVLFNFGHHSLAAFLVAVLLRYTGVSANLGSPPVALAGGAMAGLGLFSVSAIAVSAIMLVSTGRSFRASYGESFAWLLPHYIVLGLVAGGIAILFEEVGIAAVVVLCLPILLSGYSMEQFVNRTRDNVVRLEESNALLQTAVVEVGNMSEQLREAYTGTLESLVTALDVRDQETRGHSVRVATHSLDIAKMLGIHDDEELAYVYRGALMHDVGKIGVPDAILLKPAKLTEEEWEFMRRHPGMGYRILAQVPYLRPAARIVLAHHERWDGDGYPRRLKGPEIPLGARIFALCDTYDAIISDRPYRRGQAPDAAFAEILRCAGSQFDPTVTEAFEAAFPRWREESHSEAARPLYLPAWIDPDGHERAAS